MLSIVRHSDRLRGVNVLVLDSDVLRLHSLVEDFSNRIILDFDSAAVSEAERLAKSRLRVGTMDLKIAAIVLSTDSTLLTRNVIDFRRVPALRIEDWSGV